MPIIMMAATIGVVVAVLTTVLSLQAEGGVLSSLKIAVGVITGVMLGALAVAFVGSWGGVRGIFDELSGKNARLRRGAEKRREHARQEWARTLAMLSPSERRELLENKQWADRLACRPGAGELSEQELEEEGSLEEFEVSEARWHELVRVGELRREHAAAG